MLQLGDNGKRQATVAGRARRHGHQRPNHRDTLLEWDQARRDALLLLDAKPFAQAPELLRGNLLA